MTVDRSIYLHKCELSDFERNIFTVSWSKPEIADSNVVQKVGGKLVLPEVPKHHHINYRDYREDQEQKDQSLHQIEEWVSSESYSFTIQYVPRTEKSL